MLSAYDAVSHRHWREMLISFFPKYQWTVLTLPPRYFNWRIRGNSLYWAFAKRDVLNRPYDLVVATSMVDLSSLRGFVNQLGRCPTLVYCHENQFAYPDSKHQFSSLESRVLSLYTALAADTVVFNSEYNQCTYLQGAGSLLAKMPDCVPCGLHDRLTAISCVIPVPLADDCFVRSAAAVGEPLTLVWNHRWEYDKAPERLFAAIQQVLAQGVKLRLYVLGQQFRQQPDVFQQMRSWLQSNHPDVLKQWGFVADKQHYRTILASADVVLSTALHDFQGLAVLEAVAAGCLPLVPDRLCYHQWFDSRYRYRSYIDDPDLEASALAVEIAKLAALKQNNNLPGAPDVSHFGAAVLKDSYNRIFIETINRHSQTMVEPVS